MLSWLRPYTRLHPSVLRVIGAEFCFQLTQNGFFLILNFFMSQHGYSDAAIAHYLSVRFLVVLLGSLPLGFVLNRLRLISLLRLAAWMSPLGYGLILLAVPRQATALLYTGQVLVGLAMAIAQVVIVPYIMRHESRSSDAIALSFSNWSTTTFMLGLGFYVLNYGRAVPLSEELVLWVMIGFGMGAVLLLHGKLADEPAPRPRDARGKGYNWRLIAQVLAPSLIIGIGAGLSIPFISLFFKHSFDLGYQQFSLLSSVTTLLVSIASILGPRLQERYGYQVAIIWTQSLAVVALVLLGLSELLAPGPLALSLAAVCYLIRQPLMNLANPIISQFTMHSVGPENRELTSALKQALWAASWFFSTLMFQSLRAAGLSYVWVFGSTALLYAIGVAWYALLLRRFALEEDRV